MEQNRPVLITTETNQQLPILIIDKKGKIGEALAKKLQDQFLVVVITGRDLEIHDNLVHIPYRKKIPLIPDNTYSHMFVIYNGEKEIIDIMQPIMKRANDTHARALFTTSLLHANKELFHHFSAHLYHDLQFVIYGEIFDSAALDANQLNVFIHQARLYGRIEIPDPGLQRIYPVLFDDMLVGLISIAFSDHLRHKPLLVFPKHGFTQLSVARMLQKIDPLLKSDFKKQTTRPLEYFIPDNGEYVFQNYPLEDKLRKVDLRRQKPEEQIVKRKLVLPQRRKKYHLFWWISAVFLFFLTMPPLFAFVFTMVGFGLDGISLRQAEAGQLAAAGKTASMGVQTFVIADTVSSFMPLFSFLLPKQSISLGGNIQVGQTVSQTESDMFSAGQRLQNVFAGKSGDPAGDFMQSLATIKNVLLTLERMRAEGGLPQAIAEKFNSLSGVLSLVENTIDSYPALLGFSGKKTYLVLFQNNMELRPGGGFIGSFATVSMQNGQAGKPQILDVYDADGKLTQHVEPPFQLRRYLGATHWFLRDSNFDPDFIKDGEQAMQFLQKETGQRVDGVIAIDTDFLKGMLDVLGSVWVPEYNQTVSSDNFYLLVQSHAENNFFPGSTQKKDFLRALSNAILMQLEERKKIPAILFIKRLAQLIQEKHVLFAFSDEASQKLFTVNDLSSSLADARQADANSFLDYLGVVDANLGMNKTNYYLKRSLQTKVIIGDNGDATEEASITYQNTSNKASPFGGDYKNYLRFILPSASDLQSVLIDNQNVPITPAITDPLVFTQKNFVPPQELEVEESQEQNKRVIGFLVMVPMGTTKTVTITYTIRQVVNATQPAFWYDMQLFKQPGTENDPYSLFLTYPSAFKPLAKDAGFADVGGKLVYQGNMSGDTELRAEFSKK